MAYIGEDGYLTAWVAGAATDDLLAEKCISLLGDGADYDGPPEDREEEPSKGFIIQDWFGPFLLGPDSRFLRGRC
jgi:hypothetical protein